jgi:hypothetical protein
MRRKLAFQEADATYLSNGISRHGGVDVVVQRFEVKVGSGMQKQKKGNKVPADIYIPSMRRGKRALLQKARAAPVASVRALWGWRSDR